MFTFAVRPDDGEEFKVTATSRDVVLWEQVTPGRHFAHLKEASMSDFYGIAFVAAKRQGLFAGDRQAFDKGVDIDIVEDDPDPTSPGR
jgi:hypothetical protein